MTLNIILLDNPDTSGEFYSERVKSFRTYMFGTNIWSQRIWGVEAKKLGLRLLSSIFEHPLFVWGEELSELRAEADMVRANLTVIAPDPHSQRKLASHMRDMLEAIAFAEAHDASIHIG